MADTDFVSTSATLKVPRICATVITPAVTRNRTLWKAIELCFFFSVPEGSVILATTDWLSINKTDGPVTAIPKSLNLPLKSITISEAIRAATSSDPYVDDSTVFCRLLYHFTGVLFTKSIIPVTLLLVSRQCA
jgi:hypothetical protein